MERDEVEVNWRCVPNTHIPRLQIKIKSGRRRQIRLEMSTSDNKQTRNRKKSENGMMRNRGEGGG